MFDQIHNMFYVINTGYILFAFLSFALLVLGLAPNFKTRRAMILAVFIGVLATGYYSVAGLLSHPKPIIMIMEWDKPNVEKAKVLGNKIIEGYAIFVLLDWGQEHPQYYQFPFDEKMAQQLRDAEKKNKQQNGSGFVMQLPFDNSLDRRKKKWFHPIPVPKQQFPKKEPEIEEFQFKGPSKAT